jgi:uncharacterized membrane protein YfcA
VQNLLRLTFDLIGATRLSHFARSTREEGGFFGNLCVWLSNKAKRRRDTKQSLCLVIEQSEASSRYEAMIYTKFIILFMFIAALIAIAFSFGFFIESIIGFGGGLVAYALLGFFMDIKSMILVGLYIGTCASAHIWLSDRKSFSHKIFINSIPICFVGTMIGVFIFSTTSSKNLLILFGALSILLSAKIIFFDNLKTPPIFKNYLLLIGGISHGLFGIGGPFIVNALKDEFNHKSSLRTTMAAFFVVFNIVRFVQLAIQDQIHHELFFKVWWTIIPVFGAIFLGHKAHLKMSEYLFKKMIGAMTLFAGVVFLFK